MHHRACLTPRQQSKTKAICRHCELQLASSLLLAAQDQQIQVLCLMQNLSPSLPGVFICGMQQDATHQTCHALYAQVYNKHEGIKSDRQLQNSLQQVTSLHAELMLIIIKRLKQWPANQVLTALTLVWVMLFPVMTLSGSVQAEHTA